MHQTMLLMRLPSHMGTCHVLRFYRHLPAAPTPHNGKIPHLPVSKGRSVKATNKPSTLLRREYSFLADASRTVRFKQKTFPALPKPALCSEATNLVVASPRHRRCRPCAASCFAPPPHPKKKRWPCATCSLTAGTPASYWQELA